MKNCAYSIKTTRVKEPDFPYHGQTLSCTTEVLEFVKMLQDQDNEKFITIYMDAANHVICIQVVNGIVNQATVYPREVIRHALLVNACAMILVHNHPSGVVKPSDPDIRLTKIIADIGKSLDITVHDHFIIGENRFFSFREEGLMDIH